MRKTYVALAGIGLAALATALGGRTEADEGAAASPLVIDSPAEGALLGQRKVHVTGHVTGVGAAAGVLTVNGTEAKFAERKFEVDVLAQEDGPFTVDAVYGDVLTEFAGYGLLERTPTHLRLTPRGRLLSNELFQRLLPEPVA